MSKLQLAMAASGEFLAKTAHVWVGFTFLAFARGAKLRYLATNCHETKNPETLATRVSGSSGKDVIRILDEDSMSELQLAMTAPGDFEPKARRRAGLRRKRANPEIQKPAESREKAAQNGKPAISC